MFGKREIKSKKASKSGLTILLERSKDSGSMNPFEEYKQFNGEVSSC